MDDIFISIPLSNEKIICISAITREMLEDSDVDDLGDDYGYFVYEVFPNKPQLGVEIIAKAASADAALRLADLFQRAADTCRLSDDTLRQSGIIPPCLTSPPILALSRLPLVP